MTDISNLSELAKTTRPLPMAWYFDPRVFELEQRILFDQGPGYVGHELMVPNPGDYMTLEWMGHAKMLVRNDHGVELMSNVCRHRQGLLLEGRGHARHIVCPLHRWTYAIDGTLLGAPEFADKPCVSLPKTPLKRWNGLLFAGPRDVAEDLKDFSAAADREME